MNPQDPLAQLRPLHLPEAIGWWPPAPGWWALLCMVLLALTLLAHWLLRRHRRNAYRRAAIAELDLLRADNQQSFAEHANVLLRRVAIHAFPRDNVKRLSGERWIAFLDSQLKQPVFAAGLGQQMLESAYTGQTDCDTEALHAACVRWIRQHR